MLIISKIIYKYTNLQCARVSMHIQSSYKENIHSLYFFSGHYYYLFHVTMITENNLVMGLPIIYVRQVPNDLDNAGTGRPSVIPSAR